METSRTAGANGGAKGSQSRLAPHLTERELPMWAAVEANAYGKDGVAALARISLTLLMTSRSIPTRQPT